MPVCLRGSEMGVGAQTVVSRYASNMQARAGQSPKCHLTFLSLTSLAANSSYDSRSDVATCRSDRPAAAHSGPQLVSRVCARGKK